MECIKCGKPIASVKLCYCCSGACLIALLMALPDSMSSTDWANMAVDFRKHEVGTLVGEENMEFLGRITRADLVPHLNSHYKRLTENIRSCGIMREDGTIDLEHYRQVRKSHDQQEYQRHSH